VKSKRQKLPTDSNLCWWYIVFRS